MPVPRQCLRVTQATQLGTLVKPRAGRETANSGHRDRQFGIRSCPVLLVLENHGYRPSGRAGTGFSRLTPGTTGATIGITRQNWGRIGVRPRRGS